VNKTVIPGTDSRRETARVIGIYRLYNIEAQIADHVGRIHADQGFVLNYQDQIPGFCKLGHFCSGITVGNLSAAHSFQEHSLFLCVDVKAQGQCDL
jgi:hypothetical protein